MAELDLVVCGSGVAGLTAAVRAAATGLRVGVVTKGELEQSTTRWAQGGVAAVLGEDEDSVDSHLADTLAAGAGLCDIDAVRVLVGEGPDRVHELIAMGARFDTDDDGGLARAREGGHSHARVVHAGGAATGAEIERALVAAVRSSAAVLAESTFCDDLVVEGGRCRGVRVTRADGSVSELLARHVLLATGGAGQLYAVTTNPAEATGDGVAAALRAGVSVADVEFMQFHPTALHHPAMPRPLLSEALRGHGAVVRDTRGERFVDELLPRDQVARAITARNLAQGVDHCWLDATGLERFAERFPTIAASLEIAGLDPATDWLPIAPAAHYLSGGVITDLDGATALSGLWAAGEVACTGVHGANRLASNSLLEGMVFGARVVDAIDAGRDGPTPSGAMRAVLDANPGSTAPGGAARARGRGPAQGALWGAGSGGGGSGGGGSAGAGSAGGGWRAGGGIAGRPVEVLTAPQACVERGGAPNDPARLRSELQAAMTAGAGVLRSAESLERVRSVIDAIDAQGSTGAGAVWGPLGNLVTVARALVTAALVREESRGNHTRTDYREAKEEYRCRLILT